MELYSAEVHAAAITIATYFRETRPVADGWYAIFNRNALSLNLSREAWGVTISVAVGDGRVVRHDSYAETIMRDDAAKLSFAKLWLAPHEEDDRIWIPDTLAARIAAASAMEAA